jgi:hypothetical protein
MNHSKPKKGAGFIDSAKDQIVYLYHIKDYKTYVVSTDIGFEKADDMYDANPSDLRPLYPSRGSSISSKIKAPTDQHKTDTQAMNEFFDRIALNIPRNCQTIICIQQKSKAGCMRSYSA